MDKFWYILWGVLTAILTALTGYIVFIDKDKDYNNTDNYKEEYKELLQDVDSLSISIKSLSEEIDSLYTVIDTTKSKVVVIEKEYEKAYTDITNQSIRDDIEFFSNYISQNDTRLSNSNNPSSVKEN